MQKLQYASFSPQQVCKHTYKYTETTGVKYHLPTDYPPILASSNSCTKKFMKSKTNAKITICIIFTTTGMHTYKYTETTGVKYHLLSDYPPILASSNSCTKKFMKSKTNAKITICIILKTTGKRKHTETKGVKYHLPSDYPPILASSNSCTKKFMKSKTNAKITICIIFTTTGMQTHIQIHRNYRGKISLTHLIIHQY